MLCPAEKYGESGQGIYCRLVNVSVDINLSRVNCDFSA